MRRSLNYLTLIGCVLLIVFGGATSAYALRQRALQTRGYADPTVNPDLPVRLPLAGVNVELTQYDDPNLDQTLTAIAAANFTWVRQEFAWASIEPIQG
ncbi:MAG TPA: hypothetical protein VMT34_14490, partial [Aggregatilineales bacterium]|nr:hypothetical protein [Aggregatilineales bacterium]